MSKNIYALHDFSLTWASLVRDAGKTGWVVITEEIGDSQNDTSGRDYREMAEFNITPIVRLNFSHHGEGTIPLPNRYDFFAQRCANFVFASPGCTHWLIGNEPNIKVEQFDGIPITPQQYAECFYRCRKAIKQRGTQHQVIVAAIAPYNEESGWYINYWADMLKAIVDTGGADGLAIHSYSRGSAVESIWSEDKMQSYPQYYNGFRAYRDLLSPTVIPISMHQLPVYWTETDQLEPWKNENTGWVRAAYAEVDEWNRKEGTQKIYCLALYRWLKHDQWNIDGKMGVLADFNYTLKGTDYRVPETYLPSVETPTAPQKGYVTAELLNVRSGPSTNSPRVGTRAKGDAVTVLEKKLDGETPWYKIAESEWVSAQWVSIGDTPPVVTPETPVVSDTWQKSYAFVKKWEGGFQAIENDKGNWTGCQVGVGELKGTNFGISACSYPHLDIKNITPQQAEQIYLTDYWQRSGASALSYPACLVVMDTAVLHGAITAKNWLAAVGPNAYIFIARRLRSYLNADNWEFWDEAWIGRVIDLLEYVGNG